MSAASFAQRLRQGESLLSTFIKTPSHAVIEIAGDAGLDAVVIDAEHAPFDAAALDLGLLACRAARTAGLVRVPDKRPATLQQVLDLGADGVVLPHVIHPDETAEVLRALHYRGGCRGFSNSPRAGGYGRATLAEHLVNEDGRHALIAQIEDRAALEHLDALARLERIDCLLVGRADLAVSLGAERLDDPRVEAAVSQVIDTARAHGKPVGMFVSSSADLAQFAARGVSFFILGSDQALLRAGWNQQVRDFHGSTR